MYKDAIHVALNALAVLEATHPEDSRKYRRLLPALAVQFTRAGNPLNENGILKLVAWAREENVPLSSLFNAARGQSHRELSYDEIAARLKQRQSLVPDLKMIAERALIKGDLESFKNSRRPYMFTASQYEDYTRSAAIHGHTDMCLYLASYTSSPVITLCKALADAARHDQYHLIYTFLKDNVLGTDDPEELIRSALEDGTPEGDKKYEQFTAFRKMYSDFRRSSPRVQSAHFTGLETMQDFPLKLRPYLEIRSILKAEIDDIRVLNLAAFKAAMLFQSKHNLLRYFARWGKGGSDTPLRDLLEKIDAPVSKSVDWPSWADALIKYGPRMNYTIHFAQKLVSPVRNSEGQISLRLTNKKIRYNLFPHGRKFGAIGELCFEHEVKMAVLKQSIRLWKRAAKKDPDIAESIPDIDIDGNDFGLPGYRLTKMPYTDPRILFLGYYTDCCERIGGNFEPTITDAVSTRKSGFYVLTQGNEIKAHSWVWRGEGGQMVVDGWESKDSAVTSPVLISVTKLIGETLASSRYKEYGISDILLGRSNDKKFKIANCFREARRLATRYLCENHYEDNKPNQWLVRRIRKPEKFLIYNPEKLGSLGQFLDLSAETRRNDISLG
jgi:hypothetical protein